MNNPIAAVKMGSVCLAVVAAFFGGYRYASALGSMRIADLQRDYAQRAQEAEAAARSKEKESTQKLVEALNAKDDMEKTLAAERTAFSAQLNRMRESAARNQRRSTVSGSGTNTVITYQASLSSCQRLLVEGAELLSEGADLVGRTAADKDALTRVMTPNP